MLCTVSFFPNPTDCFINPAKDGMPWFGGAETLTLESKPAARLAHCSRPCSLRLIFPGYLQILEYEVLHRTPSQTLICCLPRTLSQTLICYLPRTLSQTRICYLRRTPSQALACYLSMKPLPNPHVLPPAFHVSPWMPNCRHACRLTKCFGYDPRRSLFCKRHPAYQESCCA